MSDSALSVQIRIFDQKSQRAGDGIVKALEGAGYNLVNLGVDPGIRAFAGIEIEPGIGQPASAESRKILTRLKDAGITARVIQANATWGGNLIHINIGS